MFIAKIGGGVRCESCKNYAITYIQHLHDQNADNPDWFFESFDGSENGLYYCETCKYNDYISDSEVMSVLFDGANPEDFDDDQDEPIDDLTAALVERLEKNEREKKSSSEEIKYYYLMDLERTIGLGIATYWKQNRHGYTDHIEIAGTFKKEIAEEIVAKDFDQLTVMISTDQVKKIYE